MKKKLYFSIFAGALLACSCQNELYKDATSEYQSAQGAYIIITQNFCVESDSVSLFK